MRFLRQSLVGLFLLSAAAALLAWAVATLFGAIEERRARQDQVRPPEERVVPAAVARIEPQTLAPVLTTFGEVASRRTLEIRAAAGGRIVELSPDFENGGAVSAGDLLVAIDPRDAQSALDVARTDLSEAEAGLREAERAVLLARDELSSAESQATLRTRALERARDLARRGVGTEASVETAELAEAQSAQDVLARRRALAQAEAQLDQARTSLDRRRIGLAEAERRLAETRVTAGFDGLLAEVNAVEGGLVAANERLAQLVDPDALEVSFRLSTSQYARLVSPEGKLLQASVEVVLDVFGADLRASGRITRESAAVGAGQTGRLLFATLEGAAGFRPGDFVTVRITEPELAGVALLPATALDGSGTLLVLGEGDSLSVVRVEVLRRQGNQVIVSVGDLAGSEIVTERSPLLGAGIRVRPLRPGAEVTEVEEDLVEISPERRAALIAFIEGNVEMPAEAKARVLAQLSGERVPAQIIARIESRMGG